MKKVFLSGCFDILHGGHISFFEEAKKYGDHLTVCFASDASLMLHKNRKPSLPEAHKRKVISSLRMVDEVVMGDYLEELGLDFKQHFLRIKPAVLIVAKGDKYTKEKIALCQETGTEYVMLPDTFEFENISTTEIIKNIIENNK